MPRVAGKWHFGACREHGSVTCSSAGLGTRISGCNGSSLPHPSRRLSPWIPPVVSGKGTKLTRRVFCLWGFCVGGRMWGLLWRQQNRGTRSLGSSWSGDSGQSQPGFGGDRRVCALRFYLCLRFHTVFFGKEKSESPCSDHSPVFKLGVVLPWPIQIPVFSGHSVPGSIWGALPFLTSTEELSPEPGTPPGAAALPRRRFPSIQGIESPPEA